MRYFYSRDFYTFSLGVDEFTTVYYPLESCQKPPAMVKSRDGLLQRMSMHMHFGGISIYA